MKPMIKQQKMRWVCFSVVFILLLSIIQITAQDGDPSLQQTAEYDIGFDCPVSTALDPNGTAIWVLMNNCNQSDYELHVYNIADGTRLNEDDYADELTSLSGTYIYVSAFTNAMGFTPEGDLSIYYSDYSFDIPQISSLIIPLASGGELITESSEEYNNFLLEYSDYPEFSVYSADHTQVVAAGGSSFYVLDVQNQTEIVEIPVEGGTDYALAAFSQNGEHLYITRFSEDFDVLESTLLIYSLPDATLLNEYQVPSTSVWVSPDESAVAANLYDNVGEQNELIIMNLETGAMSEVSNLNEAPTQVTTCLNSGNDMSDINIMRSGRFTFPEIHWLADSSGLVVALSYNGEGLGGGALCIFNYSRLRTYIVEAAD